MHAITIIQIYVFILAAFVGYQVISRVPPLLHTPLMSATNANPSSFADSTSARSTGVHCEAGTRETGIGPFEPCNSPPSGSDSANWK